MLHAPKNLANANFRHRKHRLASGNAWTKNASTYAMGTWVPYSSNSYLPLPSSELSKGSETFESSLASCGRMKLCFLAPGRSWNFHWEVTIPFDIADYTYMSEQWLNGLFVELVLSKKTGNKITWTICCTIAKVKCHYNKIRFSKSLLAEKYISSFNIPSSTAEAKGNG